MIPSLIITGVAGAIAWFMGYSIASLTLYAIIGGIASFLSWVIGIISTVLTYILFQILSYNNFINEDIVKMGWVTVRDLCNMFFILILLIIAFATILRIESYSWKKNLPKLLIMAVLINFSKTICGLVIDFSQVIMLTFVNAFASAGSYSLYTIFGLQNLFSIKTLVKASNTTTSMDANSGFAVVGSLVFGLILIIIATIVIAIYTIILLYRIIMLWILIILSPLAFLAMAIPAGAKYASQWTSEFSKYVVIGPVMAFFLWLALSMATTTTIHIDNKYTTNSNEMITTQTAPSGTGSVASEPANMKQFLVATLFLIASLMMAQQVGGAAGSLAGGALGKIKKGALTTGKFVGGGLLFKAGRTADIAQMKLQKGVAGLFGIKEDVYKPKSLNYRMIAAGWKAKRDKEMEKYETQHGGLTNVWHDNFNKYARLEQYGAIRKSRNRQAQDEEAAGKLDYENKTLFERQQNFVLSIPEKNEKRKELMASREERINNYKAKGFSKEEAEKEFNKDRASLVGEKTYQKMTGEDASGIKGHVARNQAEAMELRDKRYQFFGLRTGLKRATQAEPQYSKAGAKEILEKKTKEMEQRTEAKDFAVIGELIKAYEEKDQQNIAAAFRILAKNNDLNEALKDGRLMNLMTQDNGVLEKLANSMQGEEQKAFKDNMGNIKNNMRANPVSPANVQAMIQGMFAASDMEKSMAARYTSDIGTVSFSAGNSVIFGAAKGNANTGNFTFNKLNVDSQGALVSSQDRMNAIIGKFANLGTQEKIRTLHPNVIIKEAPDGSGAGIHLEGEEFLKSLTTNDLGQLNRLRLDVIRKVGGSKAVLKDAKRIVKELIDTGKEADKQKAEVIKSFIGYCINSFEGKGKEMENLAQAREAFNLKT